MRGRDLGILLVAAAALFMALQGKDEYEARRIFTIDIDPSHWKNHHTPAENEKIPPPISADLDGDGRNELIVVTREPKLVVYESSMAVTDKKQKRGSTPSSHLVVKAETTLLSKARIRSARQPVAFAVGKLDKDSKTQNVVVLTHDWSVLCYDENLKLIWEQHPVKRKSSDTYHKEAAVIITWTNVKAVDRGLVVVGAAQDLANYSRYYKKAGKVDRKTHKRAREYRKYIRENIHNKRIRKHLIEAILNGKGKRSKDSLAVEAAKREARAQYKRDQQVENLKHFSYFAMDGRTGAMRWKQENQDWSLHVRDIDTRVPQHNFKLDLHTETKHAGEVDWRMYRSSILSVLPHRWDRKEDTHFTIAHFSKRSKSTIADDTARNAALHAREIGLFEAAPLPVGKSGVRNEAIDLAKDADTKHLPNVLVSHTQKGIEVIHLYTGRTLCQMPIPPHTLNADINHDGAIDRIEAVITDEGETPMHESGHEVMGNPPTCYAWVTTGFPPTHALFNKTICTGSWSSISSVLANMQKKTRSLTQKKKRSQEREEEKNELEYEMHAAMPALVARDHKREGGSFSSMQMHDIIFAVSDGTITSYTPTGELNWQVLSSAYWVSPTLVTEAEEAGKSAREEERHLIEVEPYAQVIALPRKFPSLTPTTGKGGKIDFSSSHESSLENVLAIGSHNAILIGHDGKALTHFSLPDVPIAPAIVCDFDSDSFSDVIVTTRTGYHGYSLSKKGNHMLTFLLGSLLVLLAFMFGMTAVQNNTSSTGSARERDSYSHSRTNVPLRRVKKERATD